MTPSEQIQSEGRTLLRVAHELREWLSSATGEPEADSVLRDADVIERVGRWLSSTHAITVTDGIPSAGSASLPSLGTCRESQKPKDRDYDEASYVPCDRSNSADRWAFEAFDRLPNKLDGIYELLGPKVQGNPHGYREHVMELVVPPGAIVSALELGPATRSFDGLRNWLARSCFEGIVFHHPDGRMAKN